MEQKAINGGVNGCSDACTTNANYNPLRECVCLPCNDSHNFMCRNVQDIVIQQDNFLGIHSNPRKELLGFVKINYLI